MTGWRSTRALMAADRARLVAYFGPRETLLLQPGHLAAVLHRLAHHLHCAGWIRTARALHVLNVELTGADIDPGARIGGGLVVPNPQAVTIHGTLGENCTVMAHSSIGWPGVPTGPRSDSAGPVLGRHVALQPGSLVLGPVRIGDRVEVGARCLVTSDLPDDVEVLPLDWRPARH